MTQCNNVIYDNIKYIYIYILYIILFYYISHTLDTVCVL